MRKAIACAVVPPFIAAFLQVGCASTGRPSHEVIGAAVGGALGGGICAVAGGDPLVCTAAGVGGAIIGWGVTKAIESSSRQTQSFNAVSEDYRYRSEQGVRIEVPSVRLASSTAAPGQTVDVQATYVVLAPDPGRSHGVTETLSVWRDGRKLRDVYSEAQERTPGEWTVERHFALPGGAYPGTYELRYEVAVAGTDGSARGATTTPLVVAAR